MHIHNIAESNYLTSAGEVVTLYDIDTMQEMTSSICSDTPEGYTKRLKDVRDGKLYWVAKMKDNNCWMTQNLDLDLYGRNLTPETSDVTTTWTGGSTVESGIWNTTDDAVVRYYDPGMYVYTTPTKMDWYGCTVDGNIPTSLSQCADWVTDVSSMAASNVPNSNTVIDGQTYNAHYLFGNYYSLAAAMAGGLYGDATICPKGWTIPTTGVSGQYINLFTSYGYTFTENPNNYNLLESSIKYEDYNVVLAPFYFMAVGDISGNGIHDVGIAGYFAWKPTNHGNKSALSVGPYVLRPSNSAGAFPRTGRQIRCVAR